MSLSSKSLRPPIIASVMASMVMVAIEATIVSTAMPQIASQLGGLDLYTWVFASFLLTQTATTVICGKLADLYGRKPVMLAGIAVFLIGSVLAGFAWSMPSLIVFRLIQGVGAGAMLPVGMTIVGDLYPARERGKIQGYLASVWATSAIVGPIAGGLIIRNMSWAWIFWINVPVGLCAAAGFIVFLRENVTRECRSIDVAGAALFTLVVASLMVGLTEAGASDWRRALVGFALCGASTLAFIVQERRARDPMIDFALWGRRPIAVANGAALLSGMALIGLTTFVPMYSQGVLHQSPVVAGFALTMLLIGWPTGATLAARSFQRLGLRRVMRTGSALLPIGSLAFVLLTPESSPVLAGLGSLVMGFGMGLLSVSSLVLIQEMVDWSQRASATASNLFARNVGSTLGAAALGAVLSFGLASSTGGAVSSDDLRRLLDAPPGAPLSAASEAVRMALQQSLHLTFWAVLALSLAVALVASLLPSVSIARLSKAPAE
ncbi:MAG: MFS transporter [Methylobacteriaceae bacterium]|nr:MFS transporter [Methylobacteriaceae bacterium]MBV9246313.1 MFS transporter [Methylobacteriaceae bacterium]